MEIVEIVGEEERKSCNLEARVREGRKKQDSIACHKEPRRGLHSVGVDKGACKGSRRGLCPPCCPPC